MKKKWGIGGIILFILISVFFSINGKFIKNFEQKNQNTQYGEKKDKIYKHIFPRQIEGNNYFQGEFIANDTVSISPRRDGIVKDILVDIGDTVKKGDILAILFEPGVIGESQAKIAVDQSKLETNKKLLGEVKNVHIYELQEISQKITEKEKILSQLEKKYQSELLYIGSEGSKGGDFSVEHRELEKIQINIKNMQQTQNAQLVESKNNIEQKKEILKIQIDDVFLKIFPIIYIGNQSDVDYEKLNKSDISDLFGGKNTLVRNNFITEFQYFIENYESLSLNEKYIQLIKFQGELISVLRNTIISVDITQNQINNYIAQIGKDKTQLTATYESFVDAKNQFITLEESLKEKYDNLLQEKNKVEQKLKSLESKYQFVDAQKDLEVQKIISEIQNLETSRELMIFQQKKEIIELENTIDISQSQLYEKNIIQGDYQIISPFAGKISKRDAEVGKNISKNSEIFRLIGVDTTLAKKTKKEIKFNIPQELLGEIFIGKEIFFSLGNNQQETFSGTIHRIGGEIDNQNFTIPIQAKVDDNISLAHKSIVKVHISDIKDYFEVPSSAIYQYQGEKIIYYKKENGKFGRKVITIISDQGEFSLISGDISGKTKIITTPIFIK